MYYSMYNTALESLEKIFLPENQEQLKPKPAGLLQPLQVPGRRWQSISVDLIVQLPPTKSGNAKRVVLVDRLFKIMHLAAAPTAFDAHDMAELYMHAVIRLHGIQHEIVSDTDTLFTTQFWQDVNACMGTYQAFQIKCISSSD